jgi:hypothetical protein
MVIQSTSHLITTCRDRSLWGWDTRWRRQPKAPETPVEFEPVVVAHGRGNPGGNAKRSLPLGPLDARGRAAAGRGGACRLSKRARSTVSGGSPREPLLCALPGLVPLWLTMLLLWRPRGTRRRWPPHWGGCLAGPFPHPGFVSGHGGFQHRNWAILWCSIWRFGWQTASLVSHPSMGVFGLAPSSLGKPSWATLQLHDLICRPLVLLGMSSLQLFPSLASIPHKPNTSWPETMLLLRISP